ncbi:LacI family DNA-binding transcriptional regulator [Bifidobacterium mongoliense]|uniref:LacI family DNA-binding transcriptional regulator n=1 Tax=Bifidobacterium mongoliense TaxID=518643 RepID=UPI002A75ED7D|nr:LacI family DNA-binding transcriptional regulator [Bifidobacterium mongoliense]MDY3125800.1 LacI family DNA-binding transcriptional regulator [Bifidobacterium mongoliense]
MVTMKEIADSLGISKSTVSLVLAGKDARRVSPELSARVRSRAAEMGYWGILKLVEIVEGRRLDDARIPTMRAPLPSLDERAAEIPCTLVDKESVCARC